VTDPPPPPNGASVPAPPVLLTSLTSAALLDGLGDLSCVQETRGVPLDWGGVYGQLVRLTGPWRVELVLGGSVVDLPSTRVRVDPLPGGWRSVHRWNGLDFVQDIAPVATPAGVVRRLRFISARTEAVKVTVRSRFSPYLLPVLVEGIRPTRFVVEPKHGSVIVRKHGFALRASSRPPPSRVTLDGAPAPSGGFDGPLRELGLEYDVEIPAGGSVELGWQVAGGIGRDLEASERQHGVEPADPDLVAASLAEEDARWLARTPEVEFADAPDLTEAYGRARGALRKLYTEPGDGLVGLVAGYPWYSAIWCRDLALMLPALLWLGDAAWVERTLRSVFRFQGRKMVQVLGGEPGELPMQVAPGPIFLYGTSDTTLRFPKVVEQLHRHAGDTGSLSEWCEAIRKIVEWGHARVDPETGLLKHGGEAEAIENATAALSQVRYGIDSPDTTIWDSADRRDHANDVQVLWWSTLVATAQLMTEVGDAPRALAYRESAAFLATTLPQRYVTPEGNYLYDSIRGGHSVALVRPNALCVVSAGLLDRPTAVRVVRRAAAPDLTTDWGVRTLSSEDPTYDPQAYHGGQVWTVATAWAADAALSVGEVDLGLRYLRTIAARYREEGGFAHECYRGDRPAAFDSCFLLGFSVAPFLSVLFERLWGIVPDALGGKVEVRPNFPAGWTHARIRRLRLGPGELEIDWTPEALQVGWSGPGRLTVVGREGRIEVEPGATGTLATPAHVAGP
jgi:glycogen debranching enzyme